MYLIHRYQQKIQYAGALTRHTKYKKPICIFKDPGREPRILNPATPRSDFAVSRTRYTIYHLIRCNQTKFNSFVTLTYAENQKDLKLARYHFKLFIKFLNYEYDLKCKYVCVPERQERGAIHFHVLFFNLPFIPLQTFKDMWPHGDARIEKSKQLRSIASYVSKYVTKNSFDFPKGTRILMRSRNLVIPTTLIEGLTSFPDVVDYREPVEVTTGKLKKVIIYDDIHKSTYCRKN